jgi:carboxypeptidase Taq
LISGARRQKLKPQAEGEAALPANPIVKEILKKYEQVWALNHSMAVMQWDMETHMPEAGAKPRGMASGQLAMIIQRGNLELAGLVRKAEKSKDLDDGEKGVVRVLTRDLDYYQKVPPELVDKLQRVTTEATVAWRSARKKSSFKMFQPHLEKIISLEQEVAEKLGYEKHPYNALLDQYEEGFTVRDADAVYSKLIPASKRILAKVAAAGVYPDKHPLESKRYGTPSMEKVNEGLLQVLKMPSDRFRMDVSTHPFTVGFALSDVRITTRYEGVNFKASMYSVIHESGHALYDLGIGEDLAYSPVGRGASYGIHESQSRFWENVVGRSREFEKLVDPMLRRHLKFLSKYDREQLYYYFNTVRKGLVRVDADELTYNFHTALRYEVEKKAIAGDVKASELPSLWNDTFQDYLGIRPRNDAEGVLQDIHWSGGSFGYFATYTLGNVIVGMIWHAMKDGEMVRKALAKGDVDELKGWLGSKIHRYGSTYTPKELQMKSFGEAYNPERLIAYLDRKFTS